MNLSYDVLPVEFYWVADVAYVVLLVFAIYRAPWVRLRHNESMHVFLGGTVVLMLLWHMKAGLTPGLYYHLLGGTLFTLMFGWEFAFIGVSLVIIGTTIDGIGDWQSLSINALLMGGVPIFFSYAVYRLAVRFLPHHFFVYVIVNAFFCGGLAMALTIGVTALLLACCGPYSRFELLHGYLPFAPLMVFAEGFFSGMLATGMALMRPEWIITFDDRRYIAGK